MPMPDNRQANALPYSPYSQIQQKRCPMAKPNYAFAKRQRDLAKKQKKEEKLQRKTGTGDNPLQEDQPQDLPPQPTGDDKPAD
jgi:hypothetical protein